MTMLERFTQRARRGARFLEKAHSPAWDEGVRTVGLDLNNDRDCVLGWTYGSFWAAQGQLGLSAYQLTLYGFYLSDAEMRVSNGDTLTRRWGVLTQAWKIVLAERAAQRSA
jgi:hypothetical protein